MKLKLFLAAIILAVIGVLVWRHHAAAPTVADAKNTVSQTAKQAVKKPQTAAKAAAPSPCDDNKTGKAVIVDLSRQHMWACSDSTQAYETAVTSGATTYGDGTPTGTWAIQGKQTDRYLAGSDSRGSWNDHVDYWMPYNGDYGFHDASWQTFPFGSLTQYQTGGSHGCVHLPLAAMKWLYGWAPVGTPVTIES